jgi:hypothetical protein
MAMFNVLESFFIASPLRLFFRFSSHLLIPLLELYLHYILIIVSVTNQLRISVWQPAVSDIITVLAARRSVF